MEVISFTNSDVFNYFFSLYVYMSAPIFVGLSVMSVMRN